MIVVDTSALVAILRDEPEAVALSTTIAASAVCVIGAPTKFEFAQVASGTHGQTGLDDMKDLLDRLSIQVIAWSDAHAMVAIDAFLRFGKGRGHPAKLNFGDCMAYALAKSLDAPLLFKGDDFGKTDVKLVS